MRSPKPPSKPGDVPTESESSKTPADTERLPPAKRGAWYEMPDVVTGLHEYNGEIELDIPLGLDEGTIGASGDCELTIRHAGVSKKHARFDRRGYALCVVDLASTNGTFYGGRRVQDVRLAPGDVVTFGQTTFVAVNDEMKAQRPAFLSLLGKGHAPTPDAYLVEYALGSSNLLLYGEPYCGQHRLVTATHRVSLRRHRPLIPAPELPATDRAAQRVFIDSAHRATVVLDLFGRKAPIDPTFCSMLFSTDYQVRVIVLARQVDDARRLLTDEAVRQMKAVWLRPLALRQEEIRLLVDWLLGEIGSGVRCLDLTARNVAALANQNWPGNLDEPDVEGATWKPSLAPIARALDLIATTGGLRAAAERMGWAYSTLQHRLSRVGLTHPWFHEEAQARLDAAHGR